MIETFQSSLWSALTPPALSLPTMKGEIKADIAVVGAGILGLSLTLHLAERGVSVVLIDREEPGFGASGRNTGFVVPCFSGSITPDSLADILAPEALEKLTRFVGGSGMVLFDLVRRLSLDCDAMQTGWIQPAHTQRTVRIVEDCARQWERYGQQVRQLDRSATLHATGCPRYATALVYKTGGQINPLAYTRELARAAVAAGARIFMRSPAERLRRAADGWIVETPLGSVTADTVFCTTNALVGDLLPSVRRGLIPVRPYQVATQPLDARYKSSILPHDQPLADLHHHVFAYRWSPDGRLITGGISMFNDNGAVARMAEYYLKRLRYYLPQLPELRADFAWRGVVAATERRIPKMWQVDKGLYAPVGCNGRGIAVNTAFGKQLASFAMDGDRAHLPVAVSEPQPKALSPLLDYGPSAWLAWSSAKDWVDDRFRPV